LSKKRKNPAQEPKKADEYGYKLCANCFFYLRSHAVGDYVCTRHVLHPLHYVTNYRTVPANISCVKERNSKDPECCGKNSRFFKEKERQWESR